jgi:hypothetical protein
LLFSYNARNCVGYYEAAGRDTGITSIVHKILENTGYTSIADTGRFWKILVIPVLQILENTGYTSIADTGRLGTKLRNVLVYCFFLSVHLLSEDGQCIGRPGERRLGVGERRRGEREGRKGKRGGRNEKRGGKKEKRGGRMDKRTPCSLPLLWYSVFAANS